MWGMILAQSRQSDRNLIGSFLDKHQMAAKVLTTLYTANIEKEAS